MQYEEVKELIEIFEKTDLNDMELTLDNMSIRLNRGRAAAANTSALPPSVSAQTAPVIQQAVQAAAPAPAAAPAASNGNTETAAKEGILVKAPIVGTFYESPAPDKPPFVKVGDKVEEGDTLCIIEAMKFMNEVPSETGGTVAEILVKDGDFVEFGQELFRIVP